MRQVKFTTAMCEHIIKKDENLAKKIKAEKKPELTVSNVKGT